MKIDESEIRYIEPKLSDHFSLLWIRQHLRMIFGMTRMQSDILKDMVEQAQDDHNTLGMVLFGSVASNTEKWNSDIDILYIYHKHAPNSGLVKHYISGVVIDKFYTTLENLDENHQTVPYLLYMFAEGKILFDRSGSISPIIDSLKRYYDHHPGIREEWEEIKKMHQVEKKRSDCGQTTIIDRWNQLEEKYSDGVQKRTFFVFSTN